MEMEPHGPYGFRNFTEDELFLKAQGRHYSSELYRPSFLIRTHNLTLKRVVYSGAKSRSNFQRQDLTINFRRGEIYSVGQPESFDKARKNRQIAFKENIKTVNLFGDSYSPFVSDEHFATGRDEDDKIWIEDRNSKHGTFVNGAKLTPKIKHKLKGGDIISLGISHLDPKCQLDKGIFWVFKYKEAPNEECNLKNLYSQVFGNTLVLSNILKTIYDPYKNLLEKQQKFELTKIRTVSKFWNEISIPILQKKMEIKFKINQVGIGFEDKGRDMSKYRKESFDIWKEQFDTNEAILSSLKIRRFSFKEGIEGNSQMGAPGVDLFENFFYWHGNQFSKIDLGFSILPRTKDKEYRSKVLENLFKECKSTIKFRILEDCFTVLENVETSKSTTKLTIHSQIFSFENLFGIFPNVVKLSLGINCTESFLEFFANPQTREFAEEALKHLKVFKMPAIKLRPSVRSQPIHPQNIFLPIFLSFNMTKFPIKIEEFSLKDMLLDEGHMDINLKVVSLFAEDLIKFKLSFAESHVKQKFRIRLPKMEKLEKLVISINNRDKFRWSFELGGFPNLRIINVKSDRKKDAECEESKFLGSLLSAENKQYFPRLERAFISYGQLQSRNYAP